MSDEDKCLKRLDEWILIQKTELYDENIRNISNNANVLTDYAKSLEVLANKLIDAIKAENSKDLIALKFPKDLIECVNNLETNNDFIDRINHWCIVYPNTRTSTLLDEQIKDNIL